MRFKNKYKETYEEFELWILKHYQGKLITESISEKLKKEVAINIGKKRYIIPKKDIPKVYHKFINKKIKKQAKQIIIIRKDLKMRQGKAIAQGAHASLAILTNNLIGYPFKWYKFPVMLIKFLYLFFFHTPFRSWHIGRFTKICVYVNSEKELKDIYYKAKNKGILCSLIKDAGLTEFKGIPTYTAAALGPERSYKLDEITGNLNLL